MTNTYTTGAFLKPVKIGKYWYWVVEEFDGDTFRDGKYVNPLEDASTEDGLIQEEAEG